MKGELKQSKISEKVAASENLRVRKDGDEWIMEGVTLLSEYSRNTGPSGKPRRYSKKTQESASLNGKAVVVDHKDGSGSRSILDRIGIIEGERMVVTTFEGREVNEKVGNIRLIDVDASDHIAKLAKMDKALGGFSIEGDGEFEVHESFEFDEVRTVDVDVLAAVGTPGATRGFFESLDEDAIRGLEEAGSFDYKKPDKEKKPKPDKPNPNDEPGQPDDKGKDFPPADDEDDPDADPDDPDAEVDPNDPDAEVDPAELGVDDEDEDAEMAGDPDAVTDEANGYTEAANQSKTASSHLDAQFAHYYAAGHLWKSDETKGRARQHSEAANNHKMRSEELSRQEAAGGGGASPDSLNTAPEEVRPEGPSMESLNTLYGVSPLDALYLAEMEYDDGYEYETLSYPYVGQMVAVVAGAHDGATGEICCVECVQKSKDCPSGHSREYDYTIKVKIGDEEVEIDKPLESLKSMYKKADVRPSVNVSVSPEELYY